MLVLLILLVVTAVLARPEPPVGQYLPAEQNYGPPAKNTLGVGFGAGVVNHPLTPINPNPGTLETTQYLPPNQQYGPPRLTNTAGYDDGFNDTPAKYEFEYMVNDATSGNDFGHKEGRDGDVTRGVYYVLLPDGRRQTVEYIADQNGYRPVISYTQESNGISNGYQNDGSGYPSENNGYRY